MLRPRNSVALGAIASVLAGVGIPALGQDKPESLLPPGFGQSGTCAGAAATPSPSRPAATTPPAAAAQPNAADNPLNLLDPAGSNAEFAAVAVADSRAVRRRRSIAALPPQYEMPAYARRSLADVGPVGPLKAASRRTPSAMPTGAISRR